MIVKMQQNKTKPNRSGKKLKKKQNKKYVTLVSQLWLSSSSARYM